MAWCDDPNHKKYNEEINVFYKKQQRATFTEKIIIYDYLIN